MGFRRKLGLLRKFKIILASVKRLVLTSLIGRESHDQIFALCDQEVIQSLLMILRILSPELTKQVCHESFVKNGSRRLGRNKRSRNNCPPRGSEVIPRSVTCQHFQLQPPPTLPQTSPFIPAPISNNTLNPDLQLRVPTPSISPVEPSRLSKSSARTWGDETLHPSPWASLRIDPPNEPTTPNNSNRDRGP